MVSNDSTTKQCVKCGNIHPACRDYFYSHNVSNDGLHPWCKSCVKQYQAKLRENPKNKQYHKEYEKSPSGIDSRKRRNQSPKRKEWLLNYRRLDKFKKSNRINSSRRRARVVNLPATLTKEEWQQSIDYFHGCCAVCGRQLVDLFNSHQAHADHWIPVSKPECPGTVVSNIIPLCGGTNGCNESKGDKMPAIWLYKKFGKRKAKQILQRIQTYFESLD